MMSENEAKKLAVLTETVEDLQQTVADLQNRVTELELSSSGNGFSTFNLDDFEEER